MWRSGLVTLRRPPAPPATNVITTLEEFTREQTWAVLGEFKMVVVEGGELGVERLP